MSANKPEDQGSKQTSSNKDSENPLRDFDPDGQNARSDRDRNDKDQRESSGENPEVEQTG